MPEQSMTFEQILSTPTRLTIRGERYNGRTTYTLDNGESELSSLTVEQTGALEMVEGELLRRAEISADDKVCGKPLWEIVWAD